MAKTSKTATPEKKKGRGGSRPGAGRKPKPRDSNEAPKSNVQKRRRIVAAKRSMEPTEQADMARKFARISLEALADVALNGNSESARIAASRELLVWGFGKPSGISSETLRNGGEKAKQKPLGKRAQLKEDAQNPDTTTGIGSLMAQRAAQAEKLVN